MTHDEHLKDSLRYWQDGYRHCEVRASQIAAVAGALAALVGQLLFDLGKEIIIESFFSPKGVGVTLSFAGVCSFIASAIISIRSIQPISLKGKTGIAIHKTREAFERAALAEIESANPDNLANTLRLHGEQIYWCAAREGDTDEIYYYRSMAAAIVKFRTFTSIRARNISRAVQALIAGAYLVSGSLFLFIFVPVIKHDPATNEVKKPLIVHESHSPATLKESHGTSD